MDGVDSRELRRNTRSPLERVEQGEELAITVQGRPVAVLRPYVAPTTWMPRRQFLDLLNGHQADPGLTDDQRELARDATDDLA
jgi:prevent-host-death family protein